MAEMGARHVGDIALLCEVARPQVVVVTNVGVAHMEVFGIVGDDRRGLGRAGRGARPRRDRGVERRRPGRRRLREADRRTRGDVRAGRATPTSVPRTSCSAATARASFELVAGGDRDGGAAARARRAHGAERARRGRGRDRRSASRRRSGGRGVARRRVALADGDVRDGRGRPGPERRVQREPRVGGGRAQDGPVDGGRRPADRGARPDGRARTDRRGGARARRRARRAAPRRPADHGRGGRRRDRRGRRARGRRARAGGELRRRPTRPSPTCARTRGRATSCSSRLRGWWGSNGSRRRCDDLDPGRRRGRARRHAARHARRDPRVPAVGMGSADPRGRPPHAHGEDGHADDGRDRDPARARPGLRGLALHDRSGSPSTGLALVLAAVGFGVVGFLDDFTKVRRRRSLGLTKTQKFVGTAVVSVAFAVDRDDVRRRRSRRTCRSCAPRRSRSGCSSTCGRSSC